jgi:TfoX/Sxy family transcriptional regulator of competence genes
MTIRDDVDRLILRWPRVSFGSAFGSPGYYVRGHVFAFWRDEALVVRLPGEARSVALTYPGARRYTVPRGSSLEWVLVALDAGLSWEGIVRLLGQAYQFAGGQPPPA